MDSKNRIRVVISKIGLDGHDRGAKVISTVLKDAGMEVIYLGMFRRPEEIVRAALEEDANVIGISCLSGGHLIFVPKLKDLLKRNHMDDVLFIMGGVIPREDIPVLKKMGVNEVFTAGSLTEEIVKYIKENVRVKIVS